MSVQKTLVIRQTRYGQVENNKASYRLSACNRLIDDVWPID